MSTRLALAASLLACGGCGGEECHPCLVEVLRFPAQPPGQLDVLTVVDNSGAIEVQLPFVEMFPTFLTALGEAEVGLPELHVAVTSTNTGAYGQPITSCNGDGDNGRFQNAPRRPGCVPPSGFFISDVPANFTGTLADVYRCIATLGINGCGFEQPLEAVRRALDGRNPENENFRRSAAPLLVVVLTDEDDCSATGPELFVPEDDPVVGPLTSFRCTEFGILCNGEPIGRQPEARLLDPADGAPACEPQGALVADEPGYLWHPQVYVDFLREQVVDPRALGVAVFAGRVEPVSVQPDNDGHAELGPACAGGSAGEVDPAVRLAWFADQFGERGLFHDVCDIDFGPSLDSLAALALRLLDAACLPEGLVLTDECRIAEILSEIELPRCDDLPAPGERACWQLVTDATRCPSTSGHRRVDIQNLGFLMGATLVLRCPAPT